MSRVIFLCGPSGSRKLTYARRLESPGMVRLSFNAERWDRGISDVPLPPEVRTEIETGLRVRLLALVAQHFDHCEPPTTDEGPLVVINGPTIDEQAPGGLCQGDGHG